MEKELLEAFLKDIKKMVVDNPNDIDLGKTLRTYFNNLPELIKDFKQQLDKN
jgi:DNA-binding PucR family transcriptional regulator